MSQEKIIQFLKEHSNQEFNAYQLKRYLEIGQSIYVNLTALRKEINKARNSNELGELHYRRKDIGIKYCYVYWYCPSD